MSVLPATSESRPAFALALRKGSMSENRKQRITDEMRRCQEAFERTAERAGWPLTKTGLYKYAPEETQRRWSMYLMAWLEATCREIPERHILEVCDKNGARIKEGDVVVGYRGWVKNDGRLPKNTPEQVRVLLEVVWDRMTGAYALKELGYHPDDVEFGESRFYRLYHYCIEVAPKRALSSGVMLGGTFRGDMVCERLELYVPAASAQVATAA